MGHALHLTPDGRRIDGIIDVLHLTPDSGRIDWDALPQPGEQVVVLYYQTNGIFKVSRLESLKEMGARRKMYRAVGEISKRHQARNQI
jgi:hypothetical protein